MKLKELFTIKYGQREYHSKGFVEDIIGNTPLVSSSSSNNGFYGRFNIKPRYKNVISVANTGSIGWAFYHPYNCCIDDNCLVLEPLKEMSDGEMIYITILINKDRYRYMYGRQVTPIRISEIELPDIPNYTKNKKLENVKYLENKLINKKLLLSVKNWKDFNLKDLFEITGSKTTSISKLKEFGFGKYPFVTTQATNNGIQGFYDYFTEKGNILTIDSAVLGYCAYQPLDFSASDHVEKLIPKFEFNKYKAMFIVTLLNKEQYRYNYGRKASQTRLKERSIKLPTEKNGNPDWKFMEEYIKSLSYSASI